MSTKIIKQDTETKILIAAEHEFMTKGFAGARTTAIAEAAGVTHAMFHYYFRTKEKIFEKIVSEKVVLLKQMMFDSIFDNTLSFEEKIKHIICHHLDFIVANPYLPKFIIGEMLNESARRDVFIKEFTHNIPKIINELQKGIDKGADNGIYRRLDAKMLWLDIISLNVMPFIVSPILGNHMGKDIVCTEDFIKERKRNNLDTILRKLKI